MSTHAFESGCGQHAFGCAAAAHIHVDAGFCGLGAVHHARHIAVGDQADGRTCAADLGDDVFVARPFQHADGDVGCGAAFGTGQGFDPFARRHIKRDDARRIARTDREFVHIGVGGVQHGAARAHGDHGQRVGHVFGGQGRAFQRIKRDIDAGAGAIAHLFADEKHRGLVAFTFTDDYNACDVEHVELGAHGVDGGLIGGLFIAASNERGTGDGGGLGHTGEAE